MPATTRMRDAGGGGCCKPPKRAGWRGRLGTMGSIAMSARPRHLRRLHAGQRLAWALGRAAGGGPIRLDDRSGPERRRMTRWLLAGLVLLLAACGSEGNPLADTEWRLVALGDAGAPAGVVGGNATAEFTTATDMTGWTGCNSYTAGYRVRGSELRLDELVPRGCEGRGRAVPRGQVQTPTRAGPLPAPHPSP